MVDDTGVDAKATNEAASWCCSKLGVALNNAAVFGVTLHSLALLLDVRIFRPAYLDCSGSGGTTTLFKPPSFSATSAQATASSIVTE